MRNFVNNPDEQKAFQMVQESGKAVALNRVNNLIELQEVESTSRDEVLYLQHLKNLQEIILNY